MANNTLLASDNFASGSLAAGWSAVPGQSVCQVVAGPPNFTEANSLLTVAGQIWTGLTWPNDQASEVTVTMTGSAVATTLIQLHVRNQGGGSYSGYRAIIKDSGAWEIDVVTAGTPTVLTSGAGLTIGANDVWVFQAAGACLSLYQNFKLIGYFYDATYVSGSVGYSQQATTSLSTNEVFSWRGYSGIQQDGIWQKQGIVIPANATDLTPSGGFVFGAFQNTAILFETGQILSGTVYRTLFTSGVDANIYLAESPDGKAPWTRSVSPVISGHSNPTLTKVGSMYHVFCQVSFPGPILHYSGTSLLSLSLVGTALSPGGAGAWDQNGLFMLAVVGNFAGTWYGLYSADGGTSPFQIGLATSPDLTTWTKDATNPKLSNATVSQAIAIIGGKWYAWFYSNQPGQGNASAPFQDPFDAVRYVSSDLGQTWAVSSRSLHHTQMFESLNQIKGGISPTAIVDIGGKAYLYGLSCPGDAIGPQIYQTSLAIAPASIASIVAQPEDGFVQIASDAFTSGLGDLSSNWITPVGYTKLQIVSGPYVEGTVINTDCAMCYTGATFLANQYSEVTIKTLAVSSFIIPMVRMQTGVNSGYQANSVGPTGSIDTTKFIIYSIVAGVSTQISPASIGITPQVGDIFRLSVIDGDDGFPVLTLYQNGFVILQCQDYSKTFTSGYPGMHTFSGTLSNAQISKWAGGNANVIPAYPGSFLLCGVGK